MHFGDRDTFHVDEKTGKIFLTSKLDPEKTSQYEILIKVTDGGSLFVSNQRKAYCKLHTCMYNYISLHHGHGQTWPDDISASWQFQELGKFLFIKFGMCDCLCIILRFESYRR